MQFYIEKATPADYPAFAEISRQVWQLLDHKEWFAMDNPDYTYQVLTGGCGTGYKAIAEDTGEIAGIFLTEVPGMSEENLGRDIHLPETELPKVAHMDTAAVLPKYRGHHLQYLLMQAAEEDLRNQGYLYLMCTIHPENHASLNTALRQGYRIMTEKEKYGGYRRAILLKELTSST